MYGAFIQNSGWSPSMNRPRNQPEIWLTEPSAVDVDTQTYNERNASHFNRLRQPVHRTAAPSKYICCETVIYIFLFLRLITMHFSKSKEPTSKKTQMNLSKVLAASLELVRFAYFPLITPDHHTTHSTQKRIVCTVGRSIVAHPVATNYKAFV